MIFGERLTTQLSMAVMLKDDMAPDGKAFGELFLRATIRAAPLRHNTGYFILLNVPEGEINITAGGRFYRQITQAIDTTTLDPQKPFVELKLTPKANYPFPDGKTILRGKISGEEDEPIADASITVNGSPKHTVSEDDGRYYLKFNYPQDTQITIKVVKAGFVTQEVPVLIKKGVITPLSVKLIYV